MVIPSTAYSGMPVQLFARKAPSAIAGHIRLPHRTTAASAMPVGGQTAVTLRVSNASSRPSFADP